MKMLIENSDAPKFDAEAYQVGMPDLNDEALPDLSKLDFHPLTHGGARKECRSQAFGPHAGSITAEPLCSQKPSRKGEGLAPNDFREKQQPIHSQAGQYIRTAH